MHLWFSVAFYSAQKIVFLACLRSIYRILSSSRHSLRSNEVSSSVNPSQNCSDKPNTFDDGGEMNYDFLLDNKLVGDPFSESDWNSFLDACTRLYKPLCPSVGLLVGPSLKARSTRLMRLALFSHHIKWMFLVWIKLRYKEESVSS